MTTRLAATVIDVWQCLKANDTTSGGAATRTEIGTINQYVVVVLLMLLLSAVVVIVVVISPR